MAKRRATSKDSRLTMDRDAFFVDDSLGTVDRAVRDEDVGQKLDTILASIDQKLSYSVVYNTLTDVITYFDGGLSGTAVYTLTLTYENARKKRLVSGEWVEI